MKKFLKSIFAFVLALTVSACGSADKPVSWNSASEPPQLNSVLTSTTGSGDVLRHVMDGLVELDDNDVPVPAIAESWEVTNDGKTYTFKLRQDALWSNGEKVTAADFKFAFDLLFNPNSAAPYAGTWAPLIVGAEDVLNLQNEYSSSAVPDDVVAKALESIGYKVIDEYTLEINLTGPYEFFLDVLAFYNFLPVNEIGFNAAGGMDSYAKDADKMIYNGAFEISEWIHDSKITMTKRADYYNADLIKLDKIVFEMIADANTSLNAFESGELDITGVSGQQAIDLKEKGTEILSFDDGSSWYLEFNTTKPGLDNKKIRKALTLAVDAQKYVDKVLLNDSSVSNSFTPPAISQARLTNKVGDLMNRPVDGNMDAVVKLFEEGLKEAGITKEEFKLTITTDDTTAAKKYGAYIKEQMNSVLGIDLTVAEMTYKARIEAMQTKDFDIVMAGWGPDYNDPMTFLDMFQTGNGNNHTSWNNTEYDKLVDQARAETDQTKRDEIMVQMEKMLADEMPVGYIYNRASNYVVSDRVNGVVRTAFSNISLKYAELKEEK